MRNPFEFGREFSSEELVDRQREIAAVKAVLLGAGRLFLIGLELTAPLGVSLEETNRALDRLGAANLSPEDLAPLRAAAA
jgi:hypothetical protein